MKEKNEIDYRRVYDNYYSLSFNKLHPKKKAKIQNLQFYHFWKKYLFQFIKRLDKSNAKILDVGCGVGQHLYALRFLDFRNLEGIDLSEEQIGMLKESGFNVRVAEGTEFLAAKEDEYDFIYLFDVIEHLYKNEALKLIQSAHQALKDGGILIIGTFNANTPASIGIRYGDITHEIGLTKSSFETMLQLGSFYDNKFLFCSITDFFLWHPNILNRLLRFVFFKSATFFSSLIYWILSFPAGTILENNEFKPYMISISKKRIRNNK